MTCDCIFFSSLFIITIGRELSGREPSMSSHSNIILSAFCLFGLFNVFIKRSGYFLDFGITKSNVLGYPDLPVNDYLSVYLTSLMSNQAFTSS